MTHKSRNSFYEVGWIRLDILFESVKLILKYVQLHSNWWAESPSGPIIFVKETSYACVFGKLHAPDHQQVCLFATPHSFALLSVGCGGQYSNEVCA